MSAAGTPQTAERAELVKILRLLGRDYEWMRKRVEAMQDRGAEYSENEDIAYHEHPLHDIGVWIEARTGIKRHDIEEVAIRLNKPFGLNEYRRTTPSKSADPGAEPPHYRDMLWVLPRLHELDQDGTTDQLLRELWRRDPDFAMAANLPSPRIDGVGGDAAQSSADNGRGESADWKEVRARLERLRNQGEAYTSQARLAERMGCSAATINKAINSSPELQAWMELARKGKAAPRAIGLSGVVTDNAAQLRVEPAHEMLSDDDVDAAMARLIDQAGPTERAKLNAMDASERREMAKAYRAQKRDSEPSPLDDDPPDGPPLKVTQRKQV